MIYKRTQSVNHQTGDIWTTALCNHRNWKSCRKSWPETMQKLQLPRARVERSTTSCSECQRRKQKVWWGAVRLRNSNRLTLYRDSVTERIRVATAVAASPMLSVNMGRESELSPSTNPTATFVCREHQLTGAKQAIERGWNQWRRPESRSPHVYGEAAATIDLSLRTSAQAYHIRSQGCPTLA